MFNEKFQTLVKESCIVLKADEIKICPECGRIAPKEDNYCTQCIGRPLVEVKFI